MRPWLATLSGAILALLALSSACDSPQQVPPLDLQRGELALTLDGLDARVLQLTNIAYRIREAAPATTPEAASAADRLLEEVGLLRALCDELRRTGRSISLFPEPNAAVDLPRLKADASALFDEATRLGEHADALGAIAAAVRSAGLAGDADAISSTAALFKDRAARLSATAELLTRRADAIERSIGLVAK